MRKKQFIPKVKGVHVIIHPNFFDNIFEPKRRETEKRLNKPISQMEFTNLLAMSNVNLTVKLKSPSMNMKFAPKRKKRFTL